MRSLGFLLLAWFTLAPVSLAQPRIDTPARHVAIHDGATNRLIYCDDCRTPMPPASMSKLMTALIVQEKLASGALSPDQRFPVSERAWRFGAQSDGSHMFLELGSQVRVEDLLRGVIIVSANDACIALAEGIEGSESAFVGLMNARAKALGLESARFRNTTGLPDPEHVISAADLARLAAHVIRAHPELYAAYAQTEFTFNGKTQQNRNPLLGAFPGADGVKTGHTNDSGYGLIGSAVRGGERRIVVFNGLSSMAERRREGLKLMEAAFSAFATKQAFAAGAVVGEAEVWLGAKPTVPLLTEAGVRVVVPAATAASLRAEIVYSGPLTAPVAKGAVVGELVVSGEGLEPQRFPLIAGEAVRRKSIFGRALVGLGALLGLG